MSYLTQSERDARLQKVRTIMQSQNLDVALVYYDEFNIGNGWYLTGWCPQFESGAVLVPARGEPMILGGPESEPFAKLDSAITATRNFPVFMVPDEEYPNAIISDFPKLFAELTAMLGQVRRIGLVGAGRIPPARPPCSQKSRRRSLFTCRTRISTRARNPPPESRWFFPGPPANICRRMSKECNGRKNSTGGHG